MEVEYVDNMVKWLYDDKEIIYETKGVEFATDVATAIYIELMFDGIYEYRFVGFSGKDICKYDDNNLLTIYDENAGKHEIQLEDINDVFIIKEKIYVMNKRKSIIVYNSYFVQDEIINNISDTPVIIDEGMGISIYNQDFDENNMNVTVDGKFKFWKSENAILVLKDDIEERVLNAYRINDLNNLLFLGDDFVGIEFKNLNQEEMIEIKNSKCLL